MKRHSVAERCTLEQWLRRDGDPTALSDGRVFLEQSGRTPQRMTARDLLRPLVLGDVIRVAPPSAQAPPLRVLAQSAGLLVVDKPAGVPTIPDQHGASQSLLAQVAAHLFLPLDCVHPTSRLDREVSGVVAFALDAPTREALAEARAQELYARTYVALSSGDAPMERSGIWEAPIGRGKTALTRAVGGPNATQARTRYNHIATAGALHLWRFEPVTGRTHQLRVHASHAGYPLVGDTLYGGLTRLASVDGRIRSPGRVMLHARRVQALGESWESELPPLFEELWRTAGGQSFPLL